LIIAADCLALDDELFCVRQQRQENINVHIVVSQMADVNCGRAGLGSAVPNDVTITRIAARSTCIGAIEEQV
jgi:hypothetical protein